MTTDEFDDKRGRQTVDDEILWREVFTRMSDFR